MSDDWKSKASCRGHSDLFFAPYAERPEARVKREERARQVCATCPVSGPCRLEARDGREHGLWSSENEYQRAALGFAPFGHFAGCRVLARDLGVSITTLPLLQPGDGRLERASVDAWG